MRRIPSRRELGFALAGAALECVGAVLGAAASADPDPTLVGIASYGEDGRRLVRLWSDGRCESNYILNNAPGGLAQDWQPLEAGRFPGRRP